MDGINLLNKTRVMASCRGDGVVLRPDRPVMTSDACFAARDANCHISHTYSSVAGLGASASEGNASVVHYVFSSSATQLNDAHFSLDAADTARPYVVYNFYTGESRPLAESMTFAPGYEGHVYAVAAPVTGELAFLGEPSKYATAASARFRGGVVYDNATATLTAQVYGAAEETVTVCAVVASSLQLACASQTFATAGVLPVQIRKSH